MASSILSPCLFNLYAEYIIQNARLDETQAGIKIAGENTNNLKYAGAVSPLCPVNCGNFIFKHMRIEEKHKPIVYDLTGLFSVQYRLVAQLLHRVQLFVIP